MAWLPCLFQGRYLLDAASRTSCSAGVKAFGDLDIHLKIPDLWQQKALQALLAGKDVVIDAPTGAGKTYLVELLAQSKRRGQIVLSVPTRALANDKLREWRAKGWRVGIVTGDVTIDPEAPIVVATLETQKPRFLGGQGPSLFVIDEYQMIADATRGVSYELCVAVAPQETQLLFLSGSVSNPEEIVSWLRRLGRDPELVSLAERPVPLEEVYLDALSFNPPRSVTGFWPRLIARALMADLGPILVFAPQRRAAEGLARQLAAAFPVENPLALAPEQKRLAGGRLEKLLSKRVAYHHSGLSYQQRAGLIEPLAKAGQLRVVVATTGLAAGVNFSMRSVLVTESQYTVDHAQRMIAPDELLQMFGRAGRRGLDEIGYALVAPDRPRLKEGRKLPIRRSSGLDWPSLIAVMDAAHRSGEAPFEQALAACQRLFDPNPIELGVERSLKEGAAACGLWVDAERSRFAQPESVQFLNSQGVWEPRRELQDVPLKDVVIARGGRFKPALSDPEFVRAWGEGGLALLGKGESGKLFGKKRLIGFRDRKHKNLVQLASWVRVALAEAGVVVESSRVDVEALKHLPFERCPGLGRLAAARFERHRALGLFDLSACPQAVDVDVFGVAIAKAEARKAYPLACQACLQHPLCEAAGKGRRSAALSWRQLGLVESDGRPTRRGRVFSLFQGGEGLAIAAALEDSSYAVDAIAHDIANLRAGHRFNDHSQYSDRLARSCRKAFGDKSFEGYLQHGLPLQYGEGAAEVLAEWINAPGKARQLLGDELRLGDLQRARLEWLSLLRHIARGPDLEWERWSELQAAARGVLAEDDHHLLIDDLPPLEPGQMGRVNHRLRFGPKG